MKRKTTRVLLLIGYSIGLFVSSASGEISDIYYSDGLVHTIDGPMNDTRIYCEGDSTIVDVVEGGSIYELQAIGDSRGMLSGGTMENLIAWGSHVSISGGTILNELKAYGSARVEMSGGVIGDILDEYGLSGMLQAYDDSQIMISNSLIGTVMSNDQSQVSISGDTTVTGVGASGSSQITIYGGAIRSLSAIENSQVTVYDISMSPLSNTLVADNEGIMTFYGSEFYVDSQQVGYGEITSIFGGSFGDEPERNLGVRLDNGELFSARFYIGNNASIVLVPEPATILLLGLGAFALRKKRSP